ncbi:hypothetical protein Raf01_48040 [Rugosimonospora africana]|uniref:CU044_5270 family protein n=1 Tax=Rugosimonospora africana TaxID=556532 RepID=A0A8J3VRX1_9ACTN|nr:hypothetical protein Raf01_48040 [Rugosimonospora africana]
MSPSAAPPAAVRVRVLSGGTAPTRRRARTPRLAWSLGLSAGLAVVAVGGVVWAQATPGSGTTATGPTSAQPPTSGAQVLREAALALPQSPVVPRPGQFLYTQDVSSQALGAGSVAQRHQVWASVDGSRDGVITIGPATGDGQTQTFAKPACRDGRMPEVGTNGRIIAGKYESLACHPVPAFLASLPTDPAAMLSWLSNPKAFAGEPGSATATGGKQPAGADQLVVAFNNASDLLSDYYLTAPMESAVFNALAQLPGITVQDNVTDPSGRHGIAVGPSASSTPTPGATPTTAPQAKFTQLIFDRNSHAFLGTPMFAMVRQAIVDNAGQLPS